MARAVAARAAAATGVVAARAVAVGIWAETGHPKGEALMGEAVPTGEALRARR